MQIDRNNIFNILKEYDISPSKDYGQNFLVDSNICKSIIALLNINNKDNVLEIGPGVGSLTHFLVTDNNLVSAVEIDSNLTFVLNSFYKGYSNLIIINEDIRKVDISSYTKIVANLPYNITTELVIYLLKNASSAQKVVLMCQLETFNHFYDTKGKEYGPTSVFLHLLGDIKKEFIVKPGSFIPAPKCSSIVFSFTPNSVCSFEDAYKTYLLAKQLFLSRRKTIFNNLNSVIKNKERTTFILDSLGILKTKRPEEISYKDFLSIYSFIK